MAKKTMTDGELAALCGSEISNSMGYMSGELSGQRRRAMEYYLGEPFGNEEDGRSQVISTDVSDTIDWLMPSLMRIFTSTDEAVRFEPVGAEDEELAEQETLRVNHEFYNNCNGFLVFYSWFKDALLSKNGICKAWWSDARKVSREEYVGLSAQAVAELFEDEELEALEQETRTEDQPVIDPASGKAFIDPMTGEQVMVPQEVYDVTFRRTTVNGRMEIEIVPPEEFLISKETNGLDPRRARFVAHRRQYTTSELLELGYEEEKVRKLPYDESGGAYNDERVARRHLDDESPDWSGDTRDWSMNLVWVTECYLKVDFDGDGIAEIRKVVLGGGSQTGKSLLSNEEVDSYPFFVITPNILTHKFFGLSIADAVMDLQLIKSTVLRQMLDNLYLSNNEEKIVAEDWVVMDDLLTSRPGGIKRIKGGVENMGAIQPMPRQFWAGQAFPMLEYLDEVRRDRTGVGDTTQGLDADTLARANTGVVNQDFDAARMRIEMIARIFAETGVKALFQAIREALHKHQKKKQVVKLRNEWIDVDPRAWRERRDTTITVGLGTGNKDQQLLHLNTIWNIQKEILVTAGPDNPLVTFKNAYHTLKALAQNAGLEPSLHFNDPEPDDVEVQPQQPQQPDPQTMLVMAQVEGIKGQLQIEAKKLQIKEAEIKLEGMKWQAEMQVAQAKLQSDSGTAAQKVQADFATEREKLQAVIGKLQAEIASAESMKAADLAEKRYEADLTAQTQLTVAQIRAGLETEKFTLERDKFAATTEDYQKQAHAEVLERATAGFSEIHVTNMQKSVETDGRLSSITETLDRINREMTQRLDREAQSRVDAESARLADEKRRVAIETAEAVRSKAILSFLSENGSDKIKDFVGTIQ